MDSSNIATDRSGWQSKSLCLAHVTRSAVTQEVAGIVGGLMDMQTRILLHRQREAEIQNSEEKEPPPPLPPIVWLNYPQFRKLLEFYIDTDNRYVDMLDMMS
jgi:hypothetical protein